ncbi:MAG: hypothetical protein ACHQYP_05730 [Nitrospiria bacterium]
MSNDSSGISVYFIGLFYGNLSFETNSASQVPAVLKWDDVICENEVEHAEDE